MTKIYSVLVMEIGENVEEEVVLLVEGVMVKCFISYCPKKIMVGKYYDVEFEINFPDGEYVALAAERKKSVENIGDGFSCLLDGYLDGDVFRSFIDFPDQEIHYEYPSFNEKYIRVRAQRIDVAFE